MAVRSIDTDRDLPLEHDGLAPARGILIGLALSLALWVLVAFTATLVWPV